MELTLDEIRETIKFAKENGLKVLTIGDFHIEFMDVPMFVGQDLENILDETPRDSKRLFFGHQR